MNLITHSAAFIGFYFSVSGLVTRMHDPVSLVVMILTGAWVAVQIWAKIKTTNHLINKKKGL